MNIKEFKASLEYLFKAQITPYVHGHAGIGKSSVVKAYAKEKGYHFFPLYLGTQSDLGDVLGLADFVRDEKGTAIATTFATPVWLKECIDYCIANPDSGAILFLDEFNRARKDVLQGMFALALDKTFHTLKLPPNCHLIAAGNPPTDEYSVTDVDDTALMARFAHIKLEPTTQEWLEYAKVNKFNPDLVGFVQEQPQLLEDARSEFKLPVKVDRRAYERMNRLYEVGTPPDLISQLMRGILGLERTIAYEKYLSHSDKPIDPKELLHTNDKKVWKKLELWSTSSDIKASLLVRTSENLSSFLNEGRDMDTNAKANLLSFLNMIPKEIAYTFIGDNMKNRAPWFLDFISDKAHEGRLIELLKHAKGSKK